MKRLKLKYRHIMFSQCRAVKGWTCQSREAPHSWAGYIRPGDDGWGWASQWVHQYSLGELEDIVAFLRQVNEKRPL